MYVCKNKTVWMICCMTVFYILLCFYLMFFFVFVFLSDKANPVEVTTEWVGGGFFPGVIFFFFF